MHAAVTALLLTVLALGLPLTARAEVRPPPEVGPTYLIGPLDTLAIDVYREPTLSRNAEVRPDGSFSMPLVEDVVAVGRTPVELARELEARLSTYLVDPKVTVTVTSAAGTFEQQIKIIGARPAPGGEGEGAPSVQARGIGPPQAVVWRDGITLLDVITEVGGLSPFADGNGAYIIRRVGSERRRVTVRLDDLVEEGDPTANVPMAPGDVLVIPEGFWTGEWTFQPTAGAFVTLTDNINLVPDAVKEPAVIFSLVPGFILQGTSPRITGALDVAVTLNFREVLDDNRFNTDTGLDARLDLLGSGTAEVVENTLFVDANASVSEQAADTDRATSISEFNDTNRNPTLAAVVRPYVPHRIGRYADAVLSYSFGVFTQLRDASTIFDIAGGTTLDDTTIRNTLSYDINSGNRFRRFQWSWGNLAEHETRSDEPDIIRYESIVGLSYAIDPSFDFVSSVGYQYRDDGDPDDLVNGVTWSVGGRYHPNPRLDVSASVGQRDDRRNVSFSLAYALSPRTRISAGYSEALTTNEGQFISDVGGLTVGADGQIIDPNTGLPFNPEQGGFIFNEQTTFSRTFFANFQTAHGVNAYSLGLSGNFQDEEGTGSSSNTFFVNAGWTRQISADTSGSLQATYQRLDEDARTDDTIRFTATLNHVLYRSISGFLFYGFQNRWSNLPLAEFTENAVTVGVNSTF